jgi:hypothetical protein
MNYFRKPSFYGIIITGFIILYLLVTMYNKQNLTIIEISLFGILIGVHCLLHLGLEINYNYNPIEYVLQKN